MSYRLDSEQAARRRGARPGCEGCPGAAARRPAQQDERDLTGLSPITHVRQRRLVRIEGGMAAGSSADDLISAVIVDDHVAIVAGVRYWCEGAVPPIRLVDAGGRVAGVWTGPGADANVVILDPELVPGDPGFNELRRMVGSGRHVIVYAQHFDRAVAIRCIDLGALAYVTKRDGREYLIAAIRAAAQGLPPAAPNPRGAIRAGHASNCPQLSTRELEVLRAWFASASKELVAAKLHITVKTVDTYIARARVKYADVGRAAPTKSELLSRALDDGLITVAELNDP
jgi:DNA-binding NarL/FixJ family response regulator